MRKNHRCWSGWRGTPKRARQDFPSALNAYLNCRLKFYYKYVAGLRESEGVQDDVDPAVFGNVLHKAMERVYQRHVEQDRTDGGNREGHQRI